MLAITAKRQKVIATVTIEVCNEHCSVNGIETQQLFRRSNERIVTSCCRQV